MWQKAEGRGQRAEGKGQKAEGRRQVVSADRSGLIHRATAISGISLAISAITASNDRYPNQTF
jgi:hypothetical protein